MDVGAIEGKTQLRTDLRALQNNCGDLSQESGVLCNGKVQFCESAPIVQDFVTGY